MAKKQFPKQLFVPEYSLSSGYIDVAYPSLKAVLEEQDDEQDVAIYKLEVVKKLKKTVELV